MTNLHQFIWIVAFAFMYSLPLLETVNLPTTFKICRRSDPNLAKCVKESIEIIRPKLKTGDFGNGFVIDSLEPIRIDDIIIQRNGFNVNLFNLKANGATNFKIEKLRISVDNFKVDVIVEVPKIEAFGLYKLEMKLGVLNLKGEGNMRAFLDNLKLKISLSGTAFNKNGQQYLRIDKAQVGVKIISLKLNFENLFNGDRVLSDLGNTLVNQNIDMFIRDIEPALQKSLSRQFLKSANQVFEKAPFNVFLP